MRQSQLLYRALWLRLNAQLQAHLEGSKAGDHKDI